jgi:hypothetical protein
MIDDMEARTSHICANGGRVGFWFSYKDASSTFTPSGTPMPPGSLAQPRGSSTTAMVAYGSEVQVAGFGCYLNFSTSLSTVPSTYNAAGYTGVQFYAIGTATTPIVIVQTSATEAMTYGGTCTLGTSCMGNNAPIPNLDNNNWTLVRVPFSSLTGGSAPFDVTKIWSVEFQPGVGTFSFAIDDLSFY